MKIKVRALMLALVSLLTASLSSGGTALAATPVQNLSNGSGNPETDIQTVHITGLLSRNRDTQIGPGTREAIAIVIGICDGGILGNTSATLLAAVAGASPQIAGGLAAIPCIPASNTDGLATGINSAILVFNGTGARYIRTVRMYIDGDGVLFEPGELTQQVTAQYNAGTGEAIAQFGRTQEQIFTRGDAQTALVRDNSAFPKLVYFTVDIGDDATSGHVDVAVGLGAGDDTAQGTGGICYQAIKENCGSNFMKSGPETSSFDIVGGASSGGGGSTPPPPPGGGGSPPPPPSGGGGSMDFVALAQALDVNHNNVIDSEELVQATIYWTQGTPVPGTGGHIITNNELIQLTQLWTTGAPITGSAGGGGGGMPPPPPAAMGLKVTTIETQTLGSQGIRIEAHGRGIAGLEARIFDLAGQPVFTQAASGATLTFSGLSREGEPLANGVYLYIVTIRGLDGRTMTSEVKKLVLLR